MVRRLWPLATASVALIGALAACAPSPADEGSNLPATGARVYALVSIQVTPATAIIPAGTNQQFTATGIYSDFTTQDLTLQASWNSGATGTVTLSTSGSATAVAAGGPVTITATYGGKSGTAQLTVTAPVAASQRRPQA